MRTILIHAELGHGSLLNRLTEAGFEIHHATGGEVWIAISPDDERRLLEVLHAFVLSDWQYEYIQHCLSVTHAQLTVDQREYIGLLALHALRGSSRWSQPTGRAKASVSSRAELRDPVDEQPDFYEEFSATVRAAFADLLTAGDVLHVEGVLRFRGRRFLETVTEVTEEMVEQFLTDKEYEGFVATLRYILDVQPRSGEPLHVFCTDERVWICDDNGQLVRDPEVSRAAEQACPGEDVNAEDLAMSILITRSPCRIVIHDLTRAAPWPSFAETCERVFLERASRCQDCATCQRLQDLSAETKPADTESSDTKPADRKPTDNQSADGSSRVH
jgi:hypothetical protein